MMREHPSAWQRFHPDNLQPLFPNECARYRWEFNNRRIWPLVGFHKQRSDLTGAEQRYLGTLSGCFARNLLIPDLELLTKVRDPFALIGFALEFFADGGRRNVLLLGNRSRDETTVTITGKTTVALQMLDICIPFSEIPRPISRVDSASAQNAISQLPKMVPLDRRNKRAGIISSDMPYFGESDGRLMLLPIVGEPFLALWDIARSIARSFGMHYRESDGSKIRWLEEFVIALAHAYYLKYDTDGCFASWNQCYPLTEILLLNTGSSNGGRTKLSEVPVSDALSMIEAQFNLNPSYQRHPFWNVDQEEHQRRYRGAINRLTEIPRVAIVDMDLQDERCSETTALLISNWLES